MAKLDIIWVVSDPNADSTFGDCIYTVKPINIVDVVVGTGHQRWVATHTTFHDDARSAEQDLLGRFKKFYRDKIPTSVLLDQQQRQYSHLASLSQPLSLRRDYGLEAPMQERIATRYLQRQGA